MRFRRIVPKRRDPPTQPEIVILQKGYRQVSGLKSVLALQDADDMALRE
jgi:hypothetical protein